MVIGGSGITFALPIIQDLVQKGTRGESRVKVIGLSWIVPNPGLYLSTSPISYPLWREIIPDAMTPLLPLLTSLMNSCSYLTIDVHYTRPYTPSKSGNSGFSSTGIAEQVPMGHRIVKYPGRPGQRNLVSVMENAIVRATSDLNDENMTPPHRIPSGMLVGVCGPLGMGNDVVAAVSGIDSKMKTQIGGVEIHQEYVDLCFSE
jgi:ferric-chelate reductase